jgi:hypothetical protein
MGGSRIGVRVFGVCAAVAVAAGAALAGPLNRALVDRDATWMVHIDAEAAQKSSMHALILSALDSEDRAKLEDCRKRFGIAPGDIKGMTIYGTNIMDDGVAVLTTTGKADQLSRNLPDAGLEDFQTRVEGNIHYFSFSHEKQRFFAAVRSTMPVIPDERLVLIAGSAANLEKGLKVVAGNAPSLTVDAVPANLMVSAQPDKASIVFVVARDVGDDPKAKANFLRNARGIVMDFGETAEAPREMYANLSLTAMNAKIAEEMKQTCVGMLALGKMLAREHKVDPLVESLDGVKVVVENDRLTVTSRERSETVILKAAQLKAMIEAEEGKRPAAKLVVEKPDAAEGGEAKDKKEP